MATLKILIAPNPILSTKTEMVESVNDTVRQELNDMAETLYADKGIGLAANQVGILKQMIVMDIGEDNSLTDKPDLIKPKLYKFINPVIEWASEETVVFEEWCMSVPGQGVPISRPVKIRVKYLDENGTEKREEFSGLQARCLQHEIDHINGKITLGYLSKLKKDMAIKRIMKHYS